MLPELPVTVKTFPERPEKTPLFTVSTRVEAAIVYDEESNVSELAVMAAPNVTTPEAPPKVASFVLHATPLPPVGAVSQFRVVVFHVPEPPPGSPPIVEPSQYSRAACPLATDAKTRNR